MMDVNRFDAARAQHVKQNHRVDAAGEPDGDAGLSAPWLP